MTEIRKLTLQPPAPDVCQECAVLHAPADPHDRDSLFYQMQFQREHRRWPTWADAMAHCAPEIQSEWRAELEQLGVEVG